MRFLDKGSGIAISATRLVRDEQTALEKLVIRSLELRTHISWLCGLTELSLKM